MNSAAKSTVHLCESIQFLINNENFNFIYYNIPNQQNNAPNKQNNVSACKRINSLTDESTNRKVLQFHEEF